MRKALSMAVALILAGAMARPALADHHTTGGAAIKAEVIRNIDDAEEKLLALANATPADKFGWQPNDKVRSTGQVFLHVAGGNYFLPTLWGAKPPEGINLREIEKDAADKAKVIDAVKKSFAHARDTINALSDADLEKTVKIFGKDGTAREVVLIVATHAHEHLGQSIAYARMAGITPPWSA